ncbi:MAG: ABC transporter ATP-binding protein/permease [Candidatus Izemoplasmatales bacterium]|nr:ABC transporter ATP-binding protein/permease [Candidatus Izemoplasmatales bacterium]
MLNKKTFNLIKGNKERIYRQAFFQWLSLIFNVFILLSLTYLFYVVINDLHNPTNLFFLPLLSLCILVRILLNKKANKISAEIAVQTKIDLRNRVFRKVSRMSQEDLNQFGQAELTQLSMDGIEQLELYYSIFLPQLIFGVTAPLTLFILISFIYLPMALVLLLSVPLIPLLILFANKQARKKLPKYWNSYTNLGNIFYDNLKGLTVLKQYLADDKTHLLMNEKADDFRIETMRVLKMQLNSITIMDLVAYGGAAVSILLGVNAAIHDMLNAYVAIFLVLIAAEFFLPLRSLGSTFHIATNGLMALRKIFSILELPETNTDETEVNVILPITFNHVSFYYEKDKNVLKDISLMLPKKGLVAIVGKSGSGKSTLGMLLTKRYETKTGNILLNDININQISSISIFNHIAVLNQENYCFKGTIRDNLLLGNNGLSDFELTNALYRAGLKSFMDNIENGLDYLLNESGNNISGGEKQRLFLARMLLHPYSVYLFDEVTSSVDRQTEELMMETIQLLSKECLVIMITHRLKQALLSNLVVFINNGMIETLGTHQEVLNNINYQKMFDTQMDLEALFQRGDSR